MTGLAQTGAQFQLNSLYKVAVPVVAGSPPTFVPGQYWIDTGSGNAVKEWNGSSWVVVGSNYLALLSADPTGAVNISDLTECLDAGYTRVAATFSAATAALPAVTSNSNLITFGPFSVNMALPCQWVALVTVSTGTTGFLLDTWTLENQEQVSATQSITIAAGQLQSTQS